MIIMVATSTYVSLLLRNDVRSDKKEIRVTTFKHVYNFFIDFIRTSRQVHNYSIRKLVEI